MWLHVLGTVLVTDRVVAKTTPTRAVPTPPTTGALDPLPPPESPTGTEETGTGTSTHAHDRDRGDTAGTGTKRDSHKQTLRQ